MLFTATVDLLLCKKILGIKKQCMSEFMSHSLDRSPVKTSRCSQNEDTIEAFFHFWPQNSWQTVQLNTSLTLLMGWWQLSLCHCGTHSLTCFFRPALKLTNSINFQNLYQEDSYCRLQPLFCASVRSGNCTNTSRRLPGHCFPSLGGFPLVAVC